MLLKFRFKVCEMLSIIVQLVCKIYRCLAVGLFICFEANRRQGGGIISARQGGFKIMMGKIHRDS